jgi:hypothetical protein
MSGDGSITHCGWNPYSTNVGPVYVIKGANFNNSLYGNGGGGGGMGSNGNSTGGSGTVFAISTQAYGGGGYGAASVPLPITNAGGGGYGSNYTVSAYAGAPGSGGGGGGGTSGYTAGAWGGSGQVAVYFSTAYTLTYSSSNPPNQTYISNIAQGGPVVTGTSVLAFLAGLPSFTSANPYTYNASGYTGASLYQNGNYIVSASSYNIAGSNYASYLLSASISTVFSPNSAYTSYTGSTTTYDKVSGTWITGEWFQVQIPYSIILTTYSFYTNANASPSAVSLMGSNDGALFYTLNTHSESSATNFVYASGINTGLITNGYFSIYRWIITTGSSDSIPTSIYNIQFTNYISTDVPFSLTICYSGTNIAVVHRTGVAYLSSLSYFNVNGQNYLYAGMNADNMFASNINGASFTGTQEYTLAPYVTSPAGITTVIVSNGFESRCCFNYNGVPYIFIYYVIKTAAGSLGGTTPCYPCLYTTNFGVSWIANPITAFTGIDTTWLNGICASKTGNIMYCMYSGSSATTGNVYYSTNQSVSWNLITAIAITNSLNGRNELMCSYDGTKLFVGSGFTSNSAVITSTYSSSASTWSFTIASSPITKTGYYQASPFSPNGMCSNSTMSIMYAASAASQNILYSNNTGSSWTAVSTVPSGLASGFVFRVVCSKNAIYVFAIINYSTVGAGNIYYNKLYYSVNGNSATPTWTTVTINYPVTNGVTLTNLNTGLIDINLSPDGTYFYLLIGLSVAPSGEYLYYVPTGFSPDI